VGRLIWLRNLMSASIWNVHVCCISDCFVWRMLTDLILFVPYIVTIVIHVHQEVHTVYIKSITIHMYLSLEHEVEFTRVDDLWFYMNCTFLGAFAKLRKATISFIMSVSLSVRLCARPFVWNIPIATGRIIMKSDVWVRGLEL